MEKLIKIFEKNKGFARMKDMREAGIQTRDIAAAVDKGKIEKLKPGLYKLADYSFDENESFASVCNANKNAHTALTLFETYIHRFAVQFHHVYKQVMQHFSLFV